MEDNNSANTGQGIITLSTPREKGTSIYDSYIQSQDFLKEPVEAQSDNIIEQDLWGSVLRKADAQKRRRRRIIDISLLVYNLCGSLISLSFITEMAAVVADAGSHWDLYIVYLFAIWGFCSFVGSTRKNPIVAKLFEKIYLFVDKLYNQSPPDQDALVGKFPVCRLNVPPPPVKTTAEKLTPNKPIRKKKQSSKARRRFPKNHQGNKGPGRRLGSSKNDFRSTY